jgi:hypothetical protein
MWCEGRILCSTDEDRVCLLSDAALDLRRIPPVEVFLSNSRPASFSSGALSVKECDSELPPQPLLRNAFGMGSSSGVYGDVDVSVSDEECWLRENHRPVQTSCFVNDYSPEEILSCVTDHAPEIKV